LVAGIQKSVLIQVDVELLEEAIINANSPLATSIESEITLPVVAQLENALEPMVKGALYI
jgi:hypothetical protein